MVQKVKPSAHEPQRRALQTIPCGHVPSAEQCPPREMRAAILFVDVIDEHKKLKCLGEAPLSTQQRRQEIRNPSQKDTRPGAAVRPINSSIQGAARARKVVADPISIPQLGPGKGADVGDRPSAKVFKAQAIRCISRQLGEAQGRLGIVMPEGTTGLE